MSDRVCPKCGSKCHFGEALMVSFKCDTSYVIGCEDSLVQSDKCRIAELEAALRPFAAVELPVSFMQESTPYIFQVGYSWCWCAAYSAASTLDFHVPRACDYRKAREVMEGRQSIDTPRI
jgi:hypothetical protein